MTTEEAGQHIGYPVVYRGGIKPEYGIIKWVKGDYVFVLYDGDTNPKATNPRDIEIHHRVRGGK